MVAGVAALWSGGVVLPEDRSVHLADGDKVLAVGDPQEDEAFVFGVGSGKEDEGKQEGGKASRCSHAPNPREGDFAGQTLVCCSDQGMITLSQ